MTKRKPRIRKYPVTAYQRKALESLMPPEDLTVSEWAEKYRMLDSKTSALPGAAGAVSGKQQQEAGAAV